MTRRHALLRLAAVAATLLVWVGSKGTAWHIPFILAAIVAWGSFAAAWAWRHPDQWAAWGLRASWSAWRIHAGVTVAGVLLVAGLAWWRPVTLPSLPWYAWPLYAAWAFAQEFAVQAIVVLALLEAGTPRAWAIPIVAFAFAAGHAPVWPLAALAGLAGAAWTALFARYRNLWLVAASHAVVGALVLVVVLGQNPVGGFYGVPDH